MNAVEIGLYNKLRTTSALTTALGSATAIYDTVTPQGTALPYVIFFWAGGGHMNINPSDLHSIVYVVKALADDSAEAGVLQGHIKTALHNQALTVTSYTNIDTQCEDEIQLAETLRDGSIIHHRGYSVRVRLDN